MSDPIHRDSRAPADEATLADETAVFERCVDLALRRAPADPVLGFFGPESAMWRVCREAALPIGGMRAVLLQIAHPAVAAAGLQQSDFRQHFLPRTVRTFSTVYAMMYGDRQTALACARRVHQVHRRVRGVVAEGRQAGRPYRATDPALLFWVLATIIEGAYFSFGKLLRPMPAPLASGFYRDMCALGLLFGIPPEAMPPDLPAFEAYFEGMVREELEVGPTARELVDFLYAEGWDVGPLDEMWGLGVLPEALRDAFGLPASRRWRLGHRLLTRQLRVLLRRAPRTVRWVPPYHEAMRRVALATGRRPPLAARAVHRLDGWGAVPGVFRLPPTPR